MKVMFPPGTYVYAWDVEINVDGLRGDENRPMPQNAESIERRAGSDAASIRFWLGLQSSQPIDEQTGDAMVLQQVVQRLAEWSPYARLMKYRTLPERSCRT
jgi:hypothetical protein